MRTTRKNLKRFYPTEEDPRYGQPFQIVAVQIEDIDRYFSNWMNIKFNDNELIQLEKDWSGWRKQKQKLSDILVKALNNYVDTPIRDVVSMKVHYFGDPKGEYQII